MKLLGSLTSPFVRKARVAMLEKQVACEFVVARAGAPGSEVPLHNPLGKVPVLVRDDGRALYDSVVIVEYFDCIGSGARLIPEDRDARMEVLRIEALGDGITDAIVALTHDDRYKAPDCEPSAPWYQKQLLKIERGLAVLQEDVASRAFCHGNSFTAGDVSAGMALAYLDQSYASYPWRDKFPGLKRYAEGLLSRPSFLQTALPRS